MPDIKTNTSPKPPEVFYREFLNDTTRNHKSADRKVSKLRKIIDEIMCFFAEEPKTTIGAGIFAIGTVTAGVLTGGIAAVCLIALGALSLTLPIVTHVDFHTNRQHGAAY